MSYLNRQNSWATTGMFLGLSLLGVAIFLPAYQHYTIEQRLKYFMPRQAVVTQSDTRCYTRYSSRRRSSTYYATNIDFAFRDKNGVQQVRSGRLQSQTRDLLDLSMLPGYEQSYQVAGKQHVESGWGHSDWGAQETWAKDHWRKGATFTVFVNPYNSNDWSLSPGPSLETYYHLGLGALLAVGCGVLFYLNLVQTMRVLACDSGPEYIPSDDPVALQISEARHRTHYYN